MAYNIGMQARTKKLAYRLLKGVNKAIYQYEMIEDGDRVAVAVSGGKDSLTLLRLLDWRRSSSNEKYEIVAIHISGDADGPISPAHPPLVDWLESNGYAYVVEELNLPPEEPMPMNCQRCTWNRRKQLFEIASNKDCNVIALGHHADDLAQTTLMNLIFHGRVETMAPVSEYFSGIFRLIRPLCYLAESDITNFAKTAGFPVPPTECRRNATSQRRKVQRFIKDTQKDNPDLRKNLLKAGLRTIAKGENN